MAAQNYIAADKYKRVSDLKQIQDLTNDDLILITKKKDIGYESTNATLETLGTWEHEKFTKPDIDYLDEAKADIEHTHKLDDITDFDINEVYRRIAEQIDPEELAEAIAELNLSQYATSAELSNEISTREQADNDLVQEIQIVKDNMPKNVSELSNDSGYLIEDDLIPYTFQYTSYAPIEASTTEFILDEETPVSFFQTNEMDIEINKFVANNELEDGTYTWEVVFTGDNIHSVAFNLDNMTYVGNETLIDGNKILLENATSNFYSFSVRLFKVNTITKWLINYNYRF